MAEEVKELRQEEVFSYIDNELKIGRVSLIEKILQKTRSNFLFVFVINIIAISIATAGFFAVYSIFQERDQKLVNTEQIQGMDDIIFKEKENKGQKELDATKAQMQAIQDKLKNMEKDQAAVMAKKEAELKRQMQADLKKLSKAEQEKRKKEYMAQLKREKAKVAAQFQSKQSQLEKQQKSADIKVAKAQASIKKTEKEYKRRVTELSNQNVLARKKAEKKAKAELARKEALLKADYEKKLKEMDLSEEEAKKAKEEYEEKLTAEKARIKSTEAELATEKSKSAKALQNVEAQLIAKRKTEAFNFQVNTMFKRAISSYKAGQYKTARAKLNSVLTLYKKKPTDVTISAEKKQVDQFFVKAIDEYLTLKENDVAGDSKKLRELALALGELKTMSYQLKNGTYNKNISGANTKIQALRKKLPDVFKFYDSYDGFQVVRDDVRAYNQLKTANSAYNSRKYQTAVDKYIAVLKKYPKISSRSSVLNKMSTAILTLDKKPSGTVINVVAMDKKASPIYGSAKAQYNNGAYDSSITKFKDMIVRYPNSTYTSKALYYIDQAYIKKIEKVKPKTATIDITAMRTKQTSQAKSVYNSARSYESENKNTSAKSKYKSIIINYPLSDYTTKSISGLERIMQAEANATAKKKEKQAIAAANKNAIGLYNSGKSYYNSKSYSQAISKLQDVIIKYPKSRYTENALKYLGNAYKASVPKGADLAKIKKSQDSRAKSAYSSASSYESEKKYVSAKSKYKSIIIDYPLSDYTTKSISGLERIMQAEANTTAKKKEKQAIATANKNAVGLYNSGKSYYDNKSYSQAISKLQDVIIKYPKSRYTENALKYLASAYKASVPKGADLAKIKKSQDSRAKSAYSSASSYESQKKYSSAQSKYTAIIKDYPLSDYVNKAVTGLERVINVKSKAEALKNASSSDKQLLAAANKKASVVYEKGKSYYNKKSYSKAISEFSGMIIKYPESSYTKNAITYLERAYKAANPGGVDTIKLKTQQNTKANSAYAVAKASENGKKYETAKKQYAQLIINYPMSDYIEKSVEGIERSVAALNKKTAKLVKETAKAFTSKAVGRVIDNLGNKLMCEVYGGTKLKVGSKVYVYRTMPGKLPKYIAEGTVSEVDPMSIKIKITKKVEAVKSLDQIYKK